MIEKIHTFGLLKDASLGLYPVNPIQIGLRIAFKYPFKTPWYQQRINNGAELYSDNFVHVWWVSTRNEQNARDLRTAIKILSAKVVKFKLSASQSG